MTIKISYSKKILDKSASNLVFFSNEKFNINSLKNNLSESDFNYISDLLKTADLKKKMLTFSKKCPGARLLP